MTSAPDPDLSFMSAFPAPTQEAWRTAVDKVLKGGDFEKRLVSKTADGIRIEPLYAAASPSARPLRAEAGRWQVTTRLDHPDPAEAQKLALADLEGGANALTIAFAGASAARGYGLIVQDVAALDVALARDGLGDAVVEAGEELRAVGRGHAQGLVDGVAGGPDGVAEAVHVVVEEGREGQRPRRLGLRPRRHPRGQRRGHPRADGLAQRRGHDLIVQRVHAEVVREGREVKAQLAPRDPARAGEHLAVERRGRELHRHAAVEVPEQKAPERHVAPLAAVVAHAKARARREQPRGALVEGVGRGDRAHHARGVPVEAHGARVREKRGALGEVPGAAEHLHGLDGAVEDQRGARRLTRGVDHPRGPAEHTAERLGPHLQVRALDVHDVAHSVTASEDVKRRGVTW